MNSRVNKARAKARVNNRASNSQRLKAREKERARVRAKAKVKGSPDNNRNKASNRRRGKGRARDKDSNRLNRRSKVREKDRDAAVVRLRRTKLSNRARSWLRPISRPNPLRKARRTLVPDRAVSALAILISESSSIQIPRARKVAEAKSQTAR